MAARISDSPKRSLLKTITFRILIVAADGIIVFGLTKKLDLAITVIVLRNIVAMGLYYLHERYWNSLSWGKKKSS